MKRNIDLHVIYGAGVGLQQARLVALILMDVW